MTVNCVYIDEGMKITSTQSCLDNTLSLRWLNFIHLAHKSWSWTWYARRVTSGHYSAMVTTVIVDSSSLSLSPTVPPLSLPSLSGRHGNGINRDLRSFEIRFISNRTSRFESNGPIRKFLSRSPRLPRLPQLCRRTINNTHCWTTNFNRFGIATGIYIEFN